MSFTFGGGAFGSNTSGTSNLFGSSAGNNSLQMNSNTGGGGGGGLFGSTTATQPSTGFSSGFSFGQQPTQQTTGTTIKFQALSGNDTAVKNNIQTTINTLHQCITAMKDYESKSLEELRFEDYQAKRKYPQQTGFGTSIFGQTTTTTPTTGGGLFGSSGGVTQSTSSSTGFGLGASTGSGLFGAQNKPTTSIFGQTTTSTPTTSIFGSTATTQNKPLFGSSTSTTTGFGNTGFGGFGSTATTTPSTSIFGSTTTTFGTPTQSTGIFGSQPTTTTTSTGGLFGSTGTTGFGAPAATSTTSGGLFGQQAKPTGFGGFGTSTTTTPASSFSFGAAPAATTASTSIFGSTTPATTQAKTGFGGFGSSPFGSTTTGFGTTATTTAAPSPFGATTAAQPQSKSLFSGLGSSGFGTQSTSTSSPFGNFGTGSTLGQPASGGLTGFPTSTASTSSPFGTTGATSSTLGSTNFGFGSGGFGTSTNTSGGMFGANTSQFAQPGSTLSGGLGLFPSNQNVNTSAFVTSPPNQTVKPHLLALSNSPYGSSPLFKNIIDDFNKKEDILKPVNPIAQKSFMTDSTNIVKGGLTPSIKLTPKSINVSAITKSNSLFEGLEEDESEIQCIVPRKNIKKLIVKPRRSSTSNSMTSDKIDLLSETSNLNSPNIAAKNKEKETAKYLEESVKYFDKDNLTNDFTNISEDGDQPRNGNHYPESEDRITPISNHPAGIILNRPDYITMPSLEEIATMGDEKGNFYVDDFTIIREDYGCVTFLGRTNVANLNLDEIVQIRRKEICVYPDDKKKPEVGEGLNKEAEVTLHRVWPVDKNTNRPITDPTKLKSIRYDKKIEKQTIAMNAEFVDYSFETGSWSFRVKHFSIYGLKDDDSEEDENNETNETDESKSMLKKQLLLIKQRRLELARKKASSSAAQSIQLNINDNISEDLTLSRKSSIEENQQQLYPDLKRLEAAAKANKLFPNLTNFDDDIQTKQKYLNNLDIECRDETLMNNFDDHIQPNGGYFGQQHYDERESIYDDNKMNNIDKESQPELPLLIQKTNNFNSDQRNKTLLNTFFGTNVTVLQQMEEDLDDYTISDDTKYNKLLNQTKSKLQQSSQKSLTYGLDGNLLLKGEMKYNEQSLFELDVQQQKLFDEQHQQQDLLKLKPKLLTRYNKLTIKKADTEEKIAKYKKYLENNDYFSSTEHYPLKKLKLISYKSVNKQFIPLVESIVKDKLNNIIDMGLFNARKYRINWYHPLKYSCLNLLTNETSNNQDAIDEQRNRTSAIFSLKSPTLMLQIKQLNMNVAFYATDTDYDVIKNNCLEYLQIQYTNSKKEINESNKLPHFKPNLGNKIIFDFFNATQDMRNKIASHPDADNIDHMNAVWSLCQCLWGDLEELDLLNFREKYDVSPYEIHQLRKKSLTKWLADVSSNRVEREVKLFKYHKNDDNYLNAIFSLLTSKRVLDACLLATDNYDFRLALLISQAGSNDDVRKSIKRQINEWFSSETDKYINYDRLKLYVLLCGEITFDLSNNKTKINICENLDWKRQFGLHLWYNHLPIESISDALESYEKNVVKNYCCKPFPPYIEDKVEINKNSLLNTNNKEFYDTCYHLIKLFCDKTHQLSDIISPQCHTSNMLDHRLTWHLTMALLSLEYHHISSNCVDNLHDNYATQLQTLDLWHWSIFIVLHLNNEKKREYYVKYYLNKNVSSLIELNDQEKFVNQKLFIPLTWIYEAKALKAKYDKLLDNEVDLLIKACKWNQAHSLIVDSYGPDCLIKENVEKLEGYLNKLSCEIQFIQNWKNGGKIYLDFIKLSKEFDLLVKNEKLDEDLFKSMHEKITDLSNSLKDFDCQTTKRRQCCIKFSKLLLRLFHLFNETNNGTSMNIDVNSIEKAIQLADTVPEHTIIEDVKIQKAKYMYNALKLRSHQQFSNDNTNQNYSLNQNKNYFLESTAVN